MRIPSPLGILRVGHRGLRPGGAPHSGPSLPATSLLPRRTLAQVQPDRGCFPEVWFTSSRPPLTLLNEVGPCSAPGPRDAPPPDERTLKLRKTLRTLQCRLPTLLVSPLPPEILSPHISLHLFPTTHPHLPTVSGRVAYHAALWTAPMAWGRVPIVGNVRLEVLSEKIVPSTFSFSGEGSSYGDFPGIIGGEGKAKKESRSMNNEKLIVRWKTCGKTRGKGMGALYRGIGAREQVDKITEWLGGDVRDDEEFCGLFIFEFDEEGRVLSHTIEHAEGSGLGEGRASRVVTVTEWLLGRVKGRLEKEPELALGFEGPGREESTRRGGRC